MARLLPFDLVNYHIVKLMLYAAMIGRVDVYKRPGREGHRLQALLRGDTLKFTLELTVESK
jgi:hypothetical protein